MSRHLLRLSVSLAFACPAAQAAPSRADIAISFSERPARLVRDTTLYRAGQGVVLREQDMLDSAGGAVQLRASGALLALGPATKVFISGARELVLLDGWLKMQCAPGHAIQLGTSTLQMSCEGATVTLHAARARTELFAEAGKVSIQQHSEGKRRRPLELAQEHFAVSTITQPLQLADRPTASFIAAMPLNFRDRLVALTLGSRVLPRRERAARYAELAPWLTAHPLLRQQLRRRFDPPSPTRATPAKLPVAQH